MEVSNELVSWFITYLGKLQPTYIGVIIHLLSTTDIPVPILKCLKQTQKLKTKGNTELHIPDLDGFGGCGMNFSM